VEIIVRVLACLAAGLGMRAAARVFEVAPTTVLQWLVEAAEQQRTFSAYFLCVLHLEQLQLDEVYAVLRDLKAGAINDDEAIQRLERSPSWVWTAMAPQSKLLGVVDVGTRTLAMAQRVVHQVPRVLAPGCVPLFLTDGLKDYATALLTHFGSWRQHARRQATGPRPKPRWMPLSEMGLDDQYGVCRKAQPRYSPVRGGDRTPGQHALPGRSGRARSVDAVSRPSQLRLASREPSPTVAGSRSHQWSWLSQAVAAAYTGDGGWPDRPCVDAADHAITIPFYR
jgi:hypothetical protein